MTFGNHEELIVLLPEEWRDNLPTILSNIF